jgi:hypothetical protein
LTIEGREYRLGVDLQADPLAYRSLPQPSVHNTTVLHAASFVAGAKRRYRDSGSTPRGSCSGVRRRALSDRSIRRGQQQQEECPVSFVIGSGSAAFTALHDHVPFGCADAPVPFSAAPLQVHFKDRKSTIRHLKDWKLTIRHGNRDKRTPSRRHYTSGRWERHRIFALGRRQPRWATVWPSRCRDRTS